jgi:molybdate transport system regulatory protein
LSIYMHLEFIFASGGLGPGWASALEAIDRFGSLSAAAPATGFSSRQLWTVVQVLNSQFVQPMVEIRRSGQSSGAILTPFGKEALLRYRKMERIANETLAVRFRKFEKLVGDDPNAPPPNPKARLVDPSAIQAKRRPASRTKASRSTKKKAKS